MFNSFERLDEARAKPKNLVRKGEAGIGMSLDQVARATPRHLANKMPAKRETMWVSFSTIQRRSAKAAAKSSFNWHAALAAQ
ncbi:hypothetical protein, partial [Devosia sediminis]|uniref:hypothetical protein n=1 Tax=Devosia sediminis TaxID=2798801 RepID=UPI001AED8511